MEGKHSKNSIDMIVISFKTRLQKTMATDNESYGEVIKNEQVTCCRRWGQFAASGLQRNANWLCTKMPETDYVADLHAAQWDALS